MLFTIIDKCCFFLFFVSCYKLPKEKAKYYRYSVFNAKWYDIHDSIFTFNNEALT